MLKYPLSLLKLIDQLKKLPGVGSKSAERFAFHLLTLKHQELQEMAKSIHEIRDVIRNCGECGCLIDEENCRYCHSPIRDTHMICVVAHAKEVFSIESTHEYKGLYHVLGGVLSPLEGRGPEQLSLKKLKERISSLNIKEMVIALDSTLEGDATSLYIKEEFSPLNVNISRLAFGLPMGSSLDYVDGGTLTKAFLGRQTF